LPAAISVINIQATITTIPTAATTVSHVSISQSGDVLISNQLLSTQEPPGNLTFTLMHPHQPPMPPTIIHILPIFTPLHPSFHSITSTFILISSPSLSSHPHSTHLTPHHPSFFSSCLHLSLSFLPFPIIAKLENPQKPEKNQKKNQKQKQNKK